jgi:hypothetical protein
MRSASVHRLGLLAAGVSAFILLLPADVAKGAAPTPARVTTAKALLDDIKSDGKAALKNTRVRGRLTLKGNYELTAKNVIFEDALIGKISATLPATQRITATDVRFDDTVSFIGPNCSGDPPGLPCSLTFVARDVSFKSIVTANLGGVGGFTLRAAEFLDSASFVGGDHFSCSLCTFDQAAEFRRMNVGTTLTLRNSLFSGDVLMRDNALGPLALRNNTFKGIVDLTGTHAAEIRFPCRRGQEVYMTWSQLGRQLRESEFRATKGDPKLAAERTRSALLCWRDDLKAIGRTDDELRAQADAIRLDRDYVMDRGHPEWLLAHVREKINAYGTDPLRPLLYGVIVIVLFTFLYRVFPFVPSPDGAVSRTPRLLFAFAYSVETFVPAFEVTGIKKWGWTLEGRYRWAEVVEATLGVLISLIAAYNVAAYVF